MLTLLLLVALASAAGPVQRISVTVKRTAPTILTPKERASAQLLAPEVASVPAHVPKERAPAQLLAPAARLHKEHTAEGAIECGLKFADIDKDGRVSWRETEVIRDLALADGWLGPLKTAGFWLASQVPVKALQDAISVQQIFDDCDFNKDHYLTRDDFAKMRATCLNTPGKINDAYKYVCVKGEKGVFKHAKL